MDEDLTRPSGNQDAREASATVASDAAAAATATARMIEIVDVTAAPRPPSAIERADGRGVDLPAIAAAVARTKALIAVAAPPPVLERHLTSREIDGAAIVALLAQASRTSTLGAAAAASPAAHPTDRVSNIGAETETFAAGVAMAAMRTAAPVMLEPPAVRRPSAAPRVTPRAMTAITAAIAEALKAAPLPSPPVEIAEPARPVEADRSPADRSDGQPGRLPPSAVLVGIAQTARGAPMAAGFPAAAIPPISIPAVSARLDATGSRAALTVIPVPMTPIQLPPRPLDLALPDIGSWEPARRGRQVGAFGLRLATIALRIAILTILAAVVFWTTALIGYRYVDPPASTLMLGQYLTGRFVEQRWLPINRMSPHLIRAVLASEDGNFCRHRGVDWSAIDEALDKAAENGGRMRGASTISMQTVKNLMLWPQAHYIRKVLELPLAYAAEKAWGKRRMLELYLNIAEWGPGTFGAEAAAQLHFRKSASALSPREAALLAVALPNPIERSAGRPGPGTQRLARLIETRAVRPSLAITCLGLGRLQP